MIFTGEKSRSMLILLCSTTFKIAESAEFWIEASDYKNKYFPPPIFKSPKFYLLAPCGVGEFKDHRLRTFALKYCR